MFSLHAALVTIDSNSAAAQSPALGDLLRVRRLPPLAAVSPQTATRAARLGQTTKNGGAASLICAAIDVQSSAVKRSLTIPDHVQLAGAVESPPSQTDASAVRRLPPLIGVRQTTTSRERTPMPAHSPLADVLAHKPDGLARVLPGSAAVSGRAIFLGPPPQPATTDGTPITLGRRTLHPPGRLPSEVPSPVQGTLIR